MVFESIVVDVLNRFLGDYVENLNRSQLKLGIWGGDVVLENLILKQNALEELNIPVQTVYGHLGKLVLKIPWKNLYGASVEATIERLFLIVNPTAEVKYDPEKEEKMALAAKQAELARVEEAKKKEAEKDDKLDETFVEKLVTQIIKNVQLKISDIHVRYEDSITNPKAPFSFGVTLHNLSVHTTDENWKQTVIQEAVTKIFKILNLEGLAVYWNPATELYSKSDADNIKKRLQGEIATKSVKPSFYKYALGPINATAKLKLNPKPEGDTVKFSIPKVILSLHMEQLFVSLTKSQYQDMMLLADSMDRMTKGAPYRKYRPDLKIYRGHYKAWWHFAFKCILEEEVKRRRRNWDWNHMLSHRQLCKDYASAYQCQLSNKGKISTENKCVLDKAEKTLDLLNLVVIRQRIEMEVERLGKLEEEAKKSRGWFSGWWSGASSKDDELSEGVAIMKQFEKAMTQDEKEKLFRAIDYQENTAPLHLPTEYVAVEGYFRLDKLQVSVNDQVEVLRACVENVEVDLKQRPSANALRVDVQMRAFTVTGKCQGDLEPQLVTSKEVSKDINLLNVLFETNPLDGACDQRVKVQARPLQIIYDAQTVIEIVKLFKPPTESSALTTLQAAAENKLSDLKEKSALGMQYAVHHHTFIELDIDIAASYIIIPQTGIYKGEEACAVVKLGAISVKSAPRAAPLDVHALHRQGLPDQDILSEIAKHSYDRMALRLTEMQIVIASPKEDWHSAIASNVATPLHLLQPTNLVIQIHKCLITDDPRLPKIKIMGELQKIAVSVSEDRLLTLCEILVSMPLPQSEEATQLKASDSKGSSLSLLKYLDPVEKQKRDTARSKHRKENEHTVQLTEVEAFFIMKELVISVNRKTLQTTKEYDKFLVFSLNLLEIKATQKTFTLEATVRLGSVDMQHHRAGQKIISMIVTPELTTEVDATDKMLTTGTVVNQYLFAVTYSNEFLNNFQTAQEAIIEASSQAADAARANVQNAYQNSTKLALRVRLAAPIIIVPENSSSLNAVLVDLGRMNLNNKFVDVPAIDVDNKVTVDELMLELEDMKVSCVMLKDDDEGVVHERKLLRPTSFKLFVKRSLSSWYESLPDLDISGRMKTIAITVGHSDYKSIMKILNQNLQEGQTKTEEAKSQPSASKATSKITVKSQTSRIQAKSTVTMVTPSKEQANMPRTTIKFAFTMDSFVIDLMNTGSDDSMLVKDMDLARFCLALLSVKGRMFSDGSMNTSVLLVDCTLDDTRPGRGAKITRYLERRRENQDSKRSVSDETVANITETHEKIRSMIDITYTMKNGDTFVDMRIFSFNLILAMDFLNKIAEFMTTGLSDATPESIPKEDIKAIKLQAEKSADSMNRKKVSVVSAPVMTEQKVAMMTVNIKIEQPDIILVESLEQRECDALVLNMEMRLKLRKTEERMVADGAVSGMQVTVRRLGAQTSPAAPRFLLAPAHLSLALSQPPGQGMHLDIALTDIKITVSPEILALLNRVLATVTSREEDSVEQENQTIFYKRLWDIQPFKPTSYWFLKTEVAEEAIDLEESTSQEVVIPPVGEICLMSSPSIVLALEMEIGNETIPVLVMQASLTGQAKDWSSDFYMESTWAMQVSYYNIGRAMWEPLIEPVEILKDSQYKHIPWELRMEVVMRPQENMPSIDTSDDAANIQAVAQRLASKTITVSSSELLEITITRSGMEVLSQLGNSFAAAVGDTETSVVSKSKIDDSKSDKKYLGAPYVLHNCTGLTAKLSLVNNNDFSVFMAGNVNSDFREVLLEPGASVPLQLKHGGLNVMKLNEPPPPLKLNVKIMEMDEEIQIPVERADKRYFPIGRRMTSEMRSKNISHAAAVEARGLISDVVMHDAALHIYLRSIVQVTNTLSVAVSVYFMTLSGNEVRLLGEVAPGDTLRLPLQAVHTPTAEIFFSVEGFTVSVSPFVWRELQQEVKLSKLLQCDSKDKNSGEKFYLRAVGTMEQVFFEHSNRHTFASSCYDIVLKPAVKLQNCLPVPVIVSQLGLRRTQLFEPGEMFHLSHLAPNRASIVIMIQNYLDKCWVCTKNLPDELEELSVWSFESHDSPSVMTLELGLHSADMEGTQLLSLYCPFWMLNKTGFTLCYRKSKKPEKDSSTPNKNVDETGNVIFHPKDYKEPILFSFRAKNFFGKKKAAIRVEFGEWSDKFSLDVPGSSGVVICKNEGRSYQVAVTNQLTFNSLTKMVIFTPFFLIINECPFPIQYQELHRSGDPWGEVKQNSSAPLWPMVEKEDKLLLLRVACSTQIAAPFLYTEQHSVCLKLDNEYGGLHVEVQLSEGGTYVTVRQYRDGHAPALLVNYTPHGINVYEKENVNVRKLPSMNQMLYTWDNPAGPRILLFEGHKRKEIENDLRKDGIGDFMINESQRIWWVSFLDGLQRVILFTDDPILASGAHTIGEAEPVHTEFVLAMHGLGLSLVNDPELTEILYVSISNSGIIWEQCKIGSRRYKKIEGVKAIQIEEAYQKYLAEKMVSDSGSEVPPRVKIDDKTEVDFAMMSIIRPYERLVRRTHSPGVWAVLGLTAHSRRLHARLHRLQVDQQLPLPTFPVMLAPVPPPKSVANDDPAGTKPFIEVSIVERIMEHSKVRQYKYYKVLIQEFHVKVDMGLINALMGMFPQKIPTEQEALDAFEVDIEKARQPLEALAAMGAASDMKNFYDNLHLSPLKVHVSFSLGGATQLPTFVGTVLQSIGVTLTDMNDVVFKLSYYERNYEFLSQKELIGQVQSHYTGQALKQLYVLVLGLDVIGNPYGLVIGLKKGVEDLFYEPFQGAIQGPGEFAEGLMLGVRSLVGHTVGGAAGAVSRITGAMGHGLAALSLDKDYQRRRRDNINKPPANLQEGLARSGKGLVMGVVDGVTGVFTKPIEGAREQGVEGFFKGLGVGAVGLVARPTAGVVDFASGSFDAVKRAADMSEEVTKRRAARYLAPDAGVRPYSRLQAEGYKMLSELEKGKFVSTDTYEAHVWVIPAKEVVMCTDKRLLYLEKNNVFGGWQIVWTYLWSEIPDVPTAVAKGVYIPTAKRKVLGMFPSSGSGKVIFLYDEQQKKFLLAQCERLMRPR
ncbi:jg13113 [Pararge aegeria aegeria]|uniref:Jg13113 protein n=2 Tax=Pararge aegeria TaxID=116150 RepID=A0A8S4RAX8_9NEOP|nr:jg13113 [Pararge aegeria aegeria]